METGKRDAHFPTVFSARRRALVAGALVVGGLGFWQDVFAITVSCNGGSVGSIDLSVINGGSFPGVVGAFNATGSLAAAATACGVDHFNWYQVITADTSPPLDPSNIPVPVPFVDPISGGFSSLWADKLPWYWNETNPPSPPPSNFVNGLQLNQNTSTNALGYEDRPGGGPATDITLKTWLVGLNADSSLNMWLGGFQWEWTLNNVSIADTLSGPPPSSEYQDIIGAFALPGGPTSAVPEPSTKALLAVGLSLLLLGRRKSAP
jgi:hypothetical protein